MLETKKKILSSVTIFGAVFDHRVCILGPQGFKLERHHQKPHLVVDRNFLKKMPSFRGAFGTKRANAAMEISNKLRTFGEFGVNFVSETFCQNLSKGVDLPTVSGSFVSTKSLWSRFLHHRS